MGFIMQSRDNAKTRYGDAPIAAASVAPAPAPVADPALLDGPILYVDDIQLTSALDAAPTLDTVQPIPAALPSDISDAAPEALTPRMDCDMAMKADVRNASFVHLSLHAPCHGGSQVTIHHSGMMFSETVPASGTWQITMPALMENAVFIAAFPDGEGAVAQIDVPGVAQVDRVVLQWQGQAGLELHAREFGANYGDTGHRYHSRAGEMSAFRAGETGQMQRIGGASGAYITGDALVAEVYSFPRGEAAQDGLIDLSVEAEVTVYNCGLQIDAQTLELRDGTIVTQDLTLAMPACDTIGSFIVLNNLVQDLKIASN